MFVSPERNPMQTHGHGRPKILVSIPLLFTLLFTLFFMLASIAQARFEWRNVVQEVEIRQDGTVVVDDTRTLWTDEDFGEAFICLQHGSDVSVRLLDGSGAVSSGPPANAYTQACEDGTAGTELVVENQSRVQERRVRFVYEMTGTVEPYGDVVQWYWNLIQLDHPRIVGYELTVQIPGPMEAPYDAFVHRYDNPDVPEVTLSPDRSRLQVVFESIPQGDGVEIRYLMPPSLFTVSGTGQQLETFLRQEAELARLDVSGSPKLSVPTFTQAGSGTVAISGTARDPDGIERVVAQVRREDRVECDGTTQFTCRIPGIVPGTNPVTILAYDAEGNIASAEVSVERLGWVARMRRSLLWGLVPLALVGWLSTNMLRAYRDVGMEPDVDEMRYPFEPPNELPPAAVTALRVQNFSSSNMGAALHATIMDLARRGFATFAGTDRKFEMELHPEQGDGQLLPFERRVLEYLEAAAAGNRRGDASYLEFEELKAYSQKKGKGFLSSWGADVRAWVEQARGGPLVTKESRKTSQKWMVRSLLGAVASAVGAYVTDGTATLFFVLAIGACIVLLVIAGQALPSWRPEIAREVARWDGFKRTLTDYTRMKDAPPDFFELWDQYFCYAAAMGVAKRFLRTLERAAPLAGVEQERIMRRSTWLGPSASAAGSISSLSAAASQISSALSTASASASSGGSSGGGGGGGGGGGSSGGR